MVTEKINWLDGKSAYGMFVLEMIFSRCLKGYLKSKTYEVAMERYLLMLKCDPEVVSMTIHDPSGKVVKSYSKYAEAV